MFLRNEKILLSRLSLINASYADMQYDRLSQQQLGLVLLKSCCELDRDCWKSEIRWRPRVTLSSGSHLCQVRGVGIALYTGLLARRSRDTSRLQVLPRPAQVHAEGIVRCRHLAVSFYFSFSSFSFSFPRMDFAACAHILNIFLLFPWTSIFFKFRQKLIFAIQQLRSILFILMFDALK